MARWSPPMRCLVGSLVLIPALLLLPHVVRAHNGEPTMPMPRRAAEAPADLRDPRPPLRWSWLHWWEANRDRFLTPPAQDNALQPAEAEQLAALRAEASQELLDAIQTSTRTSLTSRAALALGKMRYEPALPALVTLAKKGNRAEIRLAAILAIGLIGSDAAEKELLQLNPTRINEQVATIAALGLLPDMEPATLRQLRAMATAERGAEKPDQVSIASVVGWSLRHHRQDDNLEYFRNLLRGSISPWVASEALIGMGGTKDHLAQRLLEDALFGAAGPDVKAHDNLNTLWRSKRDLLGIDAGNPARDERLDGDAEDAGVVAVAPELIAMAWLRSSAAIALGDIEAPRAGEALLGFLDEDTGQHPEFETPMGFAIMSLTAYPTGTTRDRLIGMVGKDDAGGKMRLDVPRTSPRRGFAALALGLYARPYATDQGPADREHIDWAIATLAERLEDDREEEEVRTACAVALGLTQRGGVLPILQKVSARLAQRNRRGDQAVLGFVFLGRALAGDQAVVEPAGRFVVGRPDDVTPGGILSRRAAVLALGLTRSASAIPVLTKAWHLNHYVNQEVILALRLVGGTNAAAPVMARLRESKDQEERAYMAQALGELLAVERPTALSRLTAGSNYTLRNPHLLPLQSLANPFLFDYLIASFGEQW